MRKISSGSPLRSFAISHVNLPKINHGRRSTGGLPSKFRSEDINSFPNRRSRLFQEAWLSHSLLLARDTFLTLFKPITTSFDIYGGQTYYGGKRQQQPAANECTASCISIWDFNVKSVTRWDDNRRWEARGRCIEKTKTCYPSWILTSCSRGCGVPWCH